MSALAVSVVVVSRGRAADLPLCLLGISQLDYPAFEVVLVADPDGINAARTVPFFDQLKTVPFDEANISAARNLGIAEAAGEIVAFIDDDAVPEPTWLTHLVAGFADPQVACVGGFVRGRNGISFQWKARTVDQTGTAHALDVDETRITVLTPEPARAIKTEGTNMALRRDVLAGIGGFDPVFRFFLDETDVNMRLATQGHKTAIAPLAQVHHGYKASATRAADRTPRDLFEIGASQMVFLRKHAPETMHSAALDKMRGEQRRRLLEHMVKGTLMPGDVRRLMKRLKLGMQDGQSRPLAALPMIAKARTGFQPMQRRVKGHEVIAGRIWSRRSLADRARRAVQNGKRATLVIFLPNAQPHRVRFTSDGVWLHRGGIFGRVDRSEVRFKLVRFKSKLAHELKRIGKVRCDLTD